MSDLDRFMLIPVDKLVYADWNYKVDDKQMSEKLRNNINRNGQVENVIVRELDDGMYEVVNGNHRLTVIKELGCEEVVCCNLGKISKVQAQRIAIETNETKFENDKIKLAQLINEIMDSYDVSDLQKTLPFTERKMDEMKSLFDWKWQSGDLSSDEFEQYELNLSLPNDLYKQWIEWMVSSKSESAEDAIEKAVDKAGEIMDQLEKEGKL